MYGITYKPLWTIDGQNCVNDVSLMHRGGGYMAQTLKRSEGRWQVRVFRGRDASGKKKFHIQTVKGTKKAALQVAREIEAAISTGTYAEPSKMSVEDFLTGWLNDTASQRLRERTLESYRKLVSTYIVPALGDTKLSQLSLPDIDQLYADMGRVQRGKKKGLSARTVRYTHSVLRSALNHAVKGRLLSHNPTDHATLPRQDRKEMLCLKPTEANAFLRAAREDRWHALWEILVLSGLRPGEALGLKWSDINGNSIGVQRTLARAGDQWLTTEPKTRRSRRTVPLADSTMKALQTHRRHQAEEKLKLGSHYHDNDFIFANTSGMPLDIKNLTARHFRKVLAAAGLAKIRLYDLRHTAATLMLEAGVNMKVASERMGHSTIVLTMDTYSHVSPEMHQDAVDRVDRLLANASA